MQYNKPGEFAFLLCIASTPHCTSHPNLVESVCMSPAPPDCPEALPENNNNKNRVIFCGLVYFFKKLSVASCKIVSNLFLLLARQQDGIILLPELFLFPLQRVDSVCCCSQLRRAKVFIALGVGQINTRRSYSDVKMPVTSSMSLLLVFSRESIFACRSVTVPLKCRFSSSM